MSINLYDIVVCIDGGHGTREYMKGSKQSPDGSIYEGEWARDIVKRIASKLEKLGIKTFIVTPEKQDISLRTRCQRVNKVYKDNNKKAILISVHINAAGADGKWHTASGWSGWVAPKASANSKKLAQLLYNEAAKLGLKGNRSVPSCKYWVGNFAMVRDTNCPAVLTENLFLDNKEEVKYLSSEEGKEAIANLHVLGILKYLNNG